VVVPSINFIAKPAGSSIRVRREGGLGSRDRRYILRERPRGAQRCRCCVLVLVLVHRRAGMQSALCSGPGDVTITVCARMHSRTDWTDCMFHPMSREEQSLPHGVSDDHGARVQSYRTVACRAQASGVLAVKKKGRTINPGRPLGAYRVLH